MDEVELIRTQLATERRHATAVANACMQALADSADTVERLELCAFCQTCVEYLAWVLTRFEARDRVLLDLGYSRHGGEDRRRQLQALLGRPGRSREALTRLQSALDRGGPAHWAGAELSWREFAEFFGDGWNARREELDEIFGRTATLAEWRAMTGLTPGAILDERSRFARVQAATPPGIELGPLPAAVRG